MLYRQNVPTSLGYHPPLSTRLSHQLSLFGRETLPYGHHVLEPDTSQRFPAPTAASDSPLVPKPGVPNQRMSLPPIRTLLAADGASPPQKETYDEEVFRRHSIVSLSSSDLSVSMKSEAYNEDPVRPGSTTSLSTGLRSGCSSPMATTYAARMTVTTMASRPKRQTPAQAPQRQSVDPRSSPSQGPESPPSETKRSPVTRNKQSSRKRQIRKDDPEDDSDWERLDEETKARRKKAAKGRKDRLEAAYYNKWFYDALVDAVPDLREQANLWREKRKGLRALKSNNVNKYMREHGEDPFPCNKDDLPQVGEVFVNNAVDLLALVSQYLRHRGLAEDAEKVKDARMKFGTVNFELPQLGADFQPVFDGKRIKR